MIQKRQINKINKVNDALIEMFGIPRKNSKTPDPVEMLIGTILSQNTNDKNSYQAYISLRKKYSSWNKIALAPVDELENVIRVAGLAKQKSLAINNFLNQLKAEQKKYSLGFINELDNKNAIDALTKYNGVGVKTASCVLLFALGRNVCPVDTHVHRIVNRIGIVNASTPDKTFFLLNENFPSNIAHPFHTNLIRLGRSICKPKSPACLSCPLLRLCTFKEKNLERQNITGKNDFMLLDNIN